MTRTDRRAEDIIKVLTAQWCHFHAFSPSRVPCTLSACVRLTALYPYWLLALLCSTCWKCFGSITYGYRSWNRISLWQKDIELALPYQTKMTLMITRREPASAMRTYFDTTPQQCLHYYCCRGCWHLRLSTCLLCECPLGNDSKPVSECIY